MANTATVKTSAAVAATMKPLTGGALVADKDRELAELHRERDLLLKRVAEMQAAAQSKRGTSEGEFELGITVHREPDEAKGDKGAKGGSIYIKLRKERVFPGYGMLQRILIEAGADLSADFPIQRFLRDYDGQILR